MEFYIQPQFIHDLAQVYDSDNDLHRELKKLLSSSKGKVYIQAASINELKALAQENPLLELLLNSRVPDIRTDFTNEVADVSCAFTSPTKYFLLESEATSYEQSHGYFCVSSQNIERASFIFNPYINLSFGKSLSGWNFVRFLRHPCNALVITDNYLLKETSEFQENFLEILDQLLPEQLNSVEFQLTIVGEDKQKGHPILPERFDELKREIVKLNRPYPINISIIKSEVHDRNIYTNYVWINTGNSFTHFKNRKLRHKTHLFCIPLAYPLKNFNSSLDHSGESADESLYEMFINRCQELSKLVKDQAGRVGVHCYVCGTRENRLLR